MLKFLLKVFENYALKIGLSIFGSLWELHKSFSNSNISIFEEMLDNARIDLTILQMH